VTVRKQFPGPGKSVSCLSPDRDETLSLAFQETGDRAAFTVPATQLYWWQLRSEILSREPW
jgi:hypothetical protein